jgi:hypothetical protein
MTRSPFLTAVFHPINLVMLVLIVVAGLCSAWWLAPVGLVFWIVMVFMIARDPGLQMTFTRQNRQPLATRFQTRFDRLDKARLSIFNAVSRSNSQELQKQIEPVQTALDELTEHAYQLCLRLTALDNNSVVQKLTSNLDNNIADMQKKISEASDDAARKEYEDTLHSLQAQQTQQKTISALLSHFETLLTGTDSVVDNVVTAVVSLQGQDPKQAGDKIPAILQSIQNEQNELKQFDEELGKNSLI